MEVCKRNSLGFVGAVAAVLRQERVDKGTETTSINVSVCGAGASAKSYAKIYGERAPNLDHLRVELDVRCAETQDGEDGDEVE